MSSDTPMRNRNNPEERLMASIRHRAYDGDAMEKAVLAAQCGEVTIFVRQLRHDLAALRAERDRLAQALRIIAGLEQCIDNTLGNVEIARRALGEEG